MRFLSVCSGLGGAELAFSGLGWECAGVAEIGPAACAATAQLTPSKRARFRKRLPSAQRGKTDSRRPAFVRRNRGSA